MARAAIATHDRTAPASPSPSDLRSRALPALLTLVLGCPVLVATASNEAVAAGEPDTAARGRVDYLTFAQGAVPIGIGGSGAKLGVSLEKAIRAVDGDGGGIDGKRLTAAGAGRVTSDREQQRRERVLALNRCVEVKCR